MFESKYPLAREFEATVIAYMITDRGFFGSVVEGLKPELLPTEEAKLCASLCMQYYADNGTTFGSLALFMQRLQAHCHQERKITLATAADAAEYVIDAVEFAKHRDDVLTEFAEILRTSIRRKSLGDVVLTGDVDSFREEVDAADRLGRVDRTQALGLGFRNVGAPKDEVERIPTGIAPVDHVTGGGFTKGQMIGILGATGDGKSLCLYQIAAAALREGKSVLVHACELNAEQALARIMADLVDMRYAALEDDIGGAQERANARMQRIGGSWGKLRIEFTPPDEGTPADTLEFIKNFSSEVLDGKMPDLVLVDYADRLEPSPGKCKPDSTDYVKQGLVWQELQKIANSNNLLLITASQAKDKKPGEKWYGKFHFADSTRKVRFIDGGFSLNWNSDKTEGGVHFFKGRKDIPVGKTLHIVPSWANSRISEISMRVKLQNVKPSDDVRGGGYTPRFIEDLEDPEPIDTNEALSFGT